MKRTASLAVTVVVGLSLAGLAAGCNSKGKSVTAADAARACAQVNIDALSLSQKFTVAAFAHTPTDAEIKDIDTSMASLRADLKKLTPVQRAALSDMLQAAGNARASLIAKTSIDAATVSQKQAVLAKACV